MRELFPEILTEQSFALRSEHLLRFRIQVGEIPLRIEGEKAIARFFQNVGHAPCRFLKRDPVLVAFLQFTDVPFRDRKPHAQAPGVKRFGEIVVRARCERLLEVLRIRPGGDEQDIHLVAAGLRAQNAAKFHAALPWQHPVENEEGKLSRVPVRFPLPRRCRRRPLRARASRSVDTNCAGCRDDPQSVKFSCLQEKLSQAMILSQSWP